MWLGRLRAACGSQVEGGANLGPCAHTLQIDHVGGGLGKKASELRMTPELLEALLAEFYHCR